MIGGDPNSSSPLEDSPTPACGVASATARLKLVDDESPIRRVPGQSRSLARPANKGKNIFLSTEDANTAPTSPLKYSTMNLYSMIDGEGSPKLPETPLLGSGPPLPPPQPLFPPLRSSQSADCEAASPQSKSLFAATAHKAVKIEDSRIPRLSTSHPIRARASTDADRPPMFSQKKTISLDAIPVAGGKDQPFGAPVASNHGYGRKTRPGPSGTTGGMSSSGRAHKRINSGDYHSLPHAASSSISRSFGQKSGLALSLSPGSLGPLPDFSDSNSSLASMSSTLTPPISAFSPAEPPIFEDVKPLQEAFESAGGVVSRRFKPRDSGVAMGEEESKPSKAPPPSSMKLSIIPRRPAMLKRTSSLGDEPLGQECVTPSVGPGEDSGWPTALSFDFLGKGAVGSSLGFNHTDHKPSMPDTPVKKHSYASNHQRVSHSVSQPEISTSSTPPQTLGESSRANIMTALPRPSLIPPPSAKKPQHLGSVRTATDVLHLTLTASVSPDSPDATDTDHSSPTARVGSSGLGMTTIASGSLPSPGPISRVGLLRRQSSGAGSSDGSEEERTPTKGGGERILLARECHREPG